MVTWNEPSRTLSQPDRRKPRTHQPENNQVQLYRWAAQNTQRWWQPGVFWPIESSRDDHGLGALVLAFKKIGFDECDDGTLENGFEKLAIYGSAFMYTHAARQLADGKWTSKLGRLEDTTHATPDDIAGSDYGEVVEFMKRPLGSVQD